VVGLIDVFNFFDVASCGKFETTPVRWFLVKRRMHSWNSFKQAFKDYIMTTVGIFTLYEGSNFRYFDLGQFLERQVTNVNRPLSVTHVEMLMALSCFIDIQESANTVNGGTFGHTGRMQLKTLIERDLVRLSPFSQVKKDIINYVPYNPMIGAVAACASAA
jgi:hypothetical protein